MASEENEHSSTGDYLFTQEETDYLMNVLLPKYTSDFKTAWEWVTYEFNDHFKIRCNRTPDAIRLKVDCVQKQRKRERLGSASECSSQSIHPDNLIKEELVEPPISTEEPNIFTLEKKLEQLHFEKDILEMEHQLKMKAMEIEILKVGLVLRKNLKV